eukprot:CAMPEP_0114388030 /NCGR_PEP_ID=MMETSP0102-20121206/7660_1 /TAXON_ID=38822 ORGANISM="Pteridomonas danica, Strain PT" /NCGR_SAMPLE_ID=MMETSP0102 /ASSEMBLY_ACC=CAM_ASM_000212 /LENGTH=1035 /DNA_ID=CAMNT_0001545341 /DNA_START=250 /DNA_END=3356 /DNA_ORIENTATION=-
MARTKYIRRPSNDDGSEAPEGYTFVTEEGARWLEGREGLILEGRDGRRARRPPERYADGVVPGDNVQAFESAARKKTKVTRSRKKADQVNGDGSGEDETSIFQESLSIRKALRGTSLENEFPDSNENGKNTSLVSNENGFYEDGIHFNLCLSLSVHPRFSPLSDQVISLLLSDQVIPCVPFGALDSRGKTVEETDDPDLGLFHKNGSNKVTQNHRNTPRDTSLEDTDLHTSNLGTDQMENMSNGQQRGPSNFKLSKSPQNNHGPPNEEIAPDDQLKLSGYDTKNHRKLYKRSLEGSEEEWSEDEPQFHLGFQNGSLTDDEEDETSTKTSHDFSTGDLDPLDSSLSAGEKTNPRPFRVTNDLPNVNSPPVDSLLLTKPGKKHRSVRADNVFPNVKDGPSNVSTLDGAHPKQRSSRSSSSSSKALGLGKKKTRKVAGKTVGKQLPSESSVTSKDSSRSQEAAPSPTFWFASAPHIKSLCKLKCPDFSSFTIVNVDGDGNCMFRSISMGLYGTEANHLLIRKAVVLLMAMFPHIFFGLIEFEDGQTFKEYLALMLTEFVYANTAESTAAQMLYGYTQETLMLSNPSAGWTPSAPGGGFTLIEVHIFNREDESNNHYMHVRTNGQPAGGWLHGKTPGAVEKEALTEFGILAECLCSANLLPPGAHGDLAWSLLKSWDFLPDIESFCEGKSPVVSHPKEYLDDEWRWSREKFPFLTNDYNLLKPLLQLMAAHMGPPEDLQKTMMIKFASSFVACYTLQCDEQRDSGLREGHVDYIYPMLRLWVMVMYRFFSQLITSRSAPAISSDAPTSGPSRTIVAPLLAPVIPTVAPRAAFQGWMDPPWIPQVPAEGPDHSLPPLFGPTTYSSLVSSNVVSQPLSASYNTSPLARFGRYGPSLIPPPVRHPLPRTNYSGSDNASWFSAGANPHDTEEADNRPGVLPDAATIEEQSLEIDRRGLILQQKMYEQQNEKRAEARAVSEKGKMQSVSNMMGRFLLTQGRFLQETGDQAPFISLASNYPGKVILPLVKRKVWDSHNLSQTYRQ